MESDQAPATETSTTPLSWRIGIGSTVLFIAILAYVTRDTIGLRGQALAGVIFFIGIVAMFSANLRAVNWRTIGWGIFLQLLLAVLVLKGKATIGGREYSVYGLLEHVGNGVKSFVSFSDAGAEFVFGNLAVPGDLATTYGDRFLFPFAFKALPPILFVGFTATLLNAAVAGLFL